MIHINKRIFIISVTILVVSVACFTLYFNLTFTPDKKLEKIIEEREELESDFEELDAQDDEEVEQDHEEPIEQVRLAFSDKINQAVQFFFTQELNIVALGDSLTQGVGDPTDEGGYIGILNRMINKEDEQFVHFYNHGKRGSRTDHLLMTINDKDVKKDLKQADIILISIGANDIMQIFKENFTNLTLTPFVAEENNYEKKLEEIFSDLRKINGRAHIYLLGFYNPFGQHFADIEELDVIVSNWNEIGENVTTSLKNISFIPIKDLFTDETNNLLADDFFHPNYEGYRLMAERVLHYMIEEGEAHHEER